MMQIKREQLDFLNWEFGVFFHFGIRTFYEGHKDWDRKPMPLDAFQPTELDCEEWIQAVHEAGGKYAVLVCKHHDGFANWPSAYTDYSVKNTPWKNGKGDVVREFTDACRKYGIKVGLYYSPAQFDTVERSAKDYDSYFINQIRELLTGYRQIHYLWFDGCGSEGHSYDTRRIIREIRACQPEILIFNMWDPDTRWVGNEAGVAHSPNMLEVDKLDFSVLTSRQDRMDRAKFLPAECDCRMRLENWFYSDGDVHTVKTVDELMGLYYYSVGRGANLLLNIGPDRSGKLPKEDKAALLEFGRKIRELNGDFITFQAETEEIKQILTFPLSLVNHVILQEEITGEEIGQFEIRAYPYPYGAPITVYRGTTIGHKAICPFPTIRTRKLEVLFDINKKVTAKLIYLPRY